MKISCFGIYTTMTLEEIIKKSKKGDIIAQRLLFERTCDQLKSVALRYVLDDGTAEDVLQEAYIRIYKSISKFNYINDAATAGWMKQITAMEAIRIIKKTKKWQAPTSVTQSPEQAIDSLAFADELYNVLLLLPTRQRVVFNMYALEGYSHKEISAKLDIAESSSRSILSRARSFLQLQLTKSDTYART